MAEGKELLDLHWLFLPLLGGFVFYTRFNALSFYARRCTGQRLLFSAGTIGFGLLAISRLVVLADERISPVQDALVSWTANLTFASSVTLLTALFITYRDSTRVESFSEELEEAPYKRHMGRALTAVTLGILGLFAVFVLPHNRRSLLYTLGFTLGLLLIAATAARLWSRWRRNLELEHRPAASFLRMSMLTMMTCELGFVWATTADILDSFWHTFVSSQNSGTAVLACLVGLVSWFPLNIVFDRDIAGALLHRAGHAGYLERFAYFAALRAWLVLITLRDGKIYVGWIQHVPPNPGAMDSYLQLIPARSGFRDRRTKEVTFTTDYARQYRSVSKENLDMEYLRQFMKLLPVSDISSVGIFAESVFEDFRRPPLLQPISYRTVGSRETHVPADSAG